MTDGTPPPAGTGWIVLAALAGAVLALLVALVADPRAWLLRTEWGQRLLQQVIEAKAPRGQAIARRNDLLPALVLPDPAGRPTALAGLVHGRPAVVNLWAPWCGPCRTEMPLLTAFSGDQGINGVQVVGIAIDAKPIVQEYLRATPLPYATLIADPEFVPEITARLGNPAGVLPYTLLVGTDGRIAKQHLGAFTSASQLADWARTD